MPKIDKTEYENAKYGNGGGFKPYTAGAYVGVIQAIRTSWEEMDWSVGKRVTKTADDDSAVLIVFDVAEGDCAGEFSRDFYMGADGQLDPRKDFMHSVVYSWADLRDLRRFDDALTASNPGFDVQAAFAADKWELYVGRKFGYVADGTVSTNERGYDQWRVRVKPWKVCSVEDIHNGNHAEPRVTDKRTKAADDAADDTTAYDADIPF